MKSTRNLCSVSAIHTSKSLMQIIQQAGQNKDMNAKRILAQMDSLTIGQVNKNDGRSEYVVN